MSMSATLFSAKFDQALTLAALAHDGVPRKGTVIPYIMHPVHVARLLDRYGYSEEVVLAGLLHDVLEDADFGEPRFQISIIETFSEFAAVERTGAAFRNATESFIAQKFGAAVLDLVSSVTEQKQDGSKPREWRVRKDEQLAHIATLKRDAAALKAADTLHNARSVLRDVQRDGLGALTRFNCKPEETLWYYGGVADGLRDILAADPLHAELDQAVYELTETVDRLLASELSDPKCRFCGNSHDAVATCGTSAGGKLAVEGPSGQRIRSLAHWFRVAPPAGGARQWVNGRSARESARAWSGLSAPADVVSLLRTSEEFIDFQPATAVAELVTPLDDLGEGRHHDLVVLGSARGKRVVVGIEAKSDEELGPVIGEYLSRVQSENESRTEQGASRLSRVPERIEGLARLVFAEKPVGFASLRYQLLHGLAGTLIEARRQGADIAVFLVHEFLSGTADDTKVERNENDFVRFVQALGASAEAARSRSLVGPFGVADSQPDSPGLRYFVGLLRTTLDSHVSKNPLPATVTQSQQTGSLRAKAIASGIQAYQDYTLMINDQPDRRLDDEQLLEDWREAFPGAKGKVFTADLAERLEIIRGVRRDYNKGVQNHGHRDPDGRLAGPAKTLSLPYRGGQTYVYSERWIKACETGQSAGSE